MKNFFLDALFYTFLFVTAVSAVLLAIAGLIIPVNGISYWGWSGWSFLMFLPAVYIAFTILMALGKLIERY